MPDQLSGAASVDSLAILALASAISAALSKRQRAALIVRLALIVADWEREDAAGEMQAAAARVVRPTLAYLQGDAEPAVRLIRRRPRTPPG